MLRLQVAPKPLPSQAAHGSIPGSRPQPRQRAGTPSPGGSRVVRSELPRHAGQTRMRMRSPVVLHSRHGRWAESAPRWRSRGRHGSVGGPTLVRQAALGNPSIGGRRRSTVGRSIRQPRSLRCLDDAGWPSHERRHVPPLAGIRCDSKQSKGFSSLVAVSEVEFESLENEIGLPVPAIVKRPNDPVGDCGRRRHRPPSHPSVRVALE